MSKRNEYTVSDYEDILKDFNNEVRKGNREYAKKYAVSYAESGNDLHYPELRESLLYFMGGCLKRLGVQLDLFEIDSDTRARYRARVSKPVCFGEV